MRIPLSFGLFVAVTLGTACADELPPTGGASELPASTVRAVERDAAATTPPSTEPACVSMAVDTVVVGETFVNASTPPEPLGGVIPSGTFVLTDITRFEAWGRSSDEDDSPSGAVPSSSFVAEKMLVVDGARYRFATRTGTRDDGVAEAVEVTSGTFGERGTNVLLAQACPARGSLELGYSVVGSTISFYTSPGRRETYTPAP